MSPGEKRRRKAKAVRKRAAYEAVLAPLKAAGATCATCKHYGPRPNGLNSRICELDSDYEGYVSVKPSHLCTRYAAKDPTK